MNYLTADQTFREQLASVKEPVEIRDSDGKVLGHFMPSISTEELSRYDEIKRLFDPAEVKRRKAAEHGQRYTVEQVVEHLKSLETSG